MNATPFWEAAYQDLNGVTFAGGKPSREFYEILSLLPPKAEVLDLGCGEGRNALFMAENGCQVTAVDISAHGIAKVQHLARRKGLSIRTQVQDMRQYRFDEDFDLIISHGCLHLIERPQWQRLLGEFKAHTAPGGFNVVAVFTDTIAPPEDLRDVCVCLFQEGELFAYYEDWQVSRRESYVIEDEHPGSLAHRHPINKIVAQKRKLLLDKENT